MYVVPVVDLRRYDALILESRSIKAASEVIPNEESNDTPRNADDGGATPFAD